MAFDLIVKKSVSVYYYDKIVPDLAKACTGLLKSF